MYEKYHTALRLMGECVATKDAVAPKGGWKSTYLSSDRPSHPCHAAWDACFTFIFVNFAKPETADFINAWQTTHPETLTTKMLLTVDSDEITRLLHSMPPELAEQVFPVAIARFLLREAALPFNHRLSSTFRQFHDWYGQMVLAC